MKTGMSTACFYGRELNEDAVKIIGDMGVRHAEIFFGSYSEYEPAFVSDIASICDSYGIEMTAVHAQPTQFEPQLFSAHPRQFKDAMLIYSKVLDAAEILGSKIYVFHGPIHLKIARKLDIDMDFVAERTAELAALAKCRGIKFCYENVHWCWFKTPDFARELLSRSCSQDIYFTLDIKQAAQSGFKYKDYIRAMGSRLAHVHLCDYIHNKENGILPVAPLNGDADFYGLAQELKKANYSGALMLEIYGDNYKNYDELREIYSRVKQVFA